MMELISWVDGINGTFAEGKFSDPVINYRIGH